MLKTISKNINKKNISKNISIKVGIPHSLSSKIIDSIFYYIIDILQNTGTFRYKNFGTLKVNQKKERVGRNPKTLKSHKITSRKTITFKASNMLKNNIN